MRLSSTEVVSARDVFIPLEDGTRLAARVWMPPVDAAPFPAVLEYVPYRKNDHMVPDDELNHGGHGALASKGFACVRVDVRGTGDSEGLFVDEYSEQELADGDEIIAWIAAQDWCCGAVGMMGISWGGFNSLQVAARRPPALKAIISACSTDDRYDNDVHYLGGSVSGDWTLTYGTMLLTLNARSPDPLVSGGAWRQMWLERLRSLEPPVHTWLEHQTRDEYWQRGSVCENLDALDCAVYMVGGWADRYVDSVLRILEGYRGPKRGLIGPWLHTWPHTGVPGPAIDFLDDAARWFRRWLLDEDNGTDREPELTVYVQDSVRPATGYERREGRWITFDRWPPADRLECELTLSSHGLLSSSEEAASASGLRARSSLLVGAGSGDSTGFLNPDADFPGDQRLEDALSLTFTSAPLDEPVAILGRPRVRLMVAADRTAADICVRLCDVHPDGASTIISRGFLNLSHRTSHAEVEPVVPGQPYDISVPMKAIGYEVPVGHRIRLSVSPNYWPWIWPAPQPVTLTISEGGNELSLPLCPAEGGTKEWRESPHRVNLTFEPLETPPLKRAVSWNANTNELVTVRDYSVGGTFRVVASDLKVEHWFHDVFTVTLDDPTTARVECEHSATLERPDWRTHAVIRSTMTGDDNTFHVVTSLIAYFEDRAIFSKEWRHDVPRVL